MRICPVCQSCHSDSIEFCPHDKNQLTRFDLRRELRAKRSGNPRTTADSVIFLLSEEWLPVRLRREVSTAAKELKSNPRLFLLEMFRSDSAPGYRRSLGRSVALSLIGISACFSAALLLVGLLSHFSARADISRDSKPDKASDDRDRVIAWTAARPETPVRASRQRGMSGGSGPESARPHGGGGGGAKMEEPALLGVTAIASLQPQIMTPSPEPPKIEHPSLPVPATVYADPKSLPPLIFPIGDLLGKENSHSWGPGQEFGLGSGRKGGLGPGVGPGYGRGQDGNTGDDGFETGGKRRGTYSNDEVPWANERIRPIIVYKERARYTEEARQNQVQGTVLLRATFSAEGRILDIRVIRGLPDGLTENAIAAAQRIRFQPALQNGLPISVRASLEFNFKIY